MHKIRFIQIRNFAVLSGLLAISLVASACSPKTPQFAVEQPVFKAVLGNGLRLVVIPDTTTPLVQVDVRYEVGANEDPMGKAGLAHLVEHMMFQHRFGPDTVPIADRPPTFEILPQIATSYNAYTTWDKTHYFLQAPKKDLRKLLALEAARLNTGCKLIPEEQFLREREVVRNEIRGGASPEGQVFAETIRAAFPKGHPYHETPGGDDAQISNITMADVCTFMENYYATSRATVIVTGNVNRDEVGTLVNQFFGGIAAVTPAPRKEVVPVQLRNTTISKKFDIERTIVNIMWAMPKHFTPEYDNASFMKYVLAGRAGELADEYEVCDILFVNEIGGSQAPVMNLSFEMRPGKSVDECLKFVWEAAATTHRVFESGEFRQEHMQRSLVKQGFVGAMEPISARAEFVADAVQFERRIEFSGDDNYFYKYLENIDTLDADKFQGYVQSVLGRDKALVFVAQANSSGNKGDVRSKLDFSGKSHTQRATPMMDPNTAHSALSVPERNSVLDSAERYTLGNGLKVVLLPYKGFPLVQANLIFSTGSIAEATSKAGLANLAGQLRLPSDSAAIHASGVQMRRTVGMTHTTFKARGVNIYLAEVIHGVERVVKAGTLSQKSIEKFRKDFKQGFARPNYQRRYKFRLALAESLYGKDHPYVTKGDATPATIDKYGKDAALDFGRTHYSASNGTLVVAGNFDPKWAKELIGDSFGNWGAGHKDTVEGLESQIADHGPKYIGVLNKKGVPQMDIRIAFPAPGVDGNTAARSVLTEMVNLRVARVRSELGSTYGMYARHNHAIGPSAYQIGGSVDAPEAGKTLKFIREKLQDLRDGVEFNRDFVTARHAVLRRLLAESTESYTLAERLSNIAMFGLKPDFYDDLARQVAQLQPKQVQALMAAELDPNREVIVGFADRETLQAAFTEAGLPAPRIVE